jgi:superfamily II RNA helicase
MGGGPGGGPNSQKSVNSKFENFFKNLRKIKAMNLLPCIAFLFSRAAVEELA